MKHLDKLKHFAAGLVVAVIVYLLTASLAFAAAAVMLTGAGKELWDSYHPGHTEDFLDVMATCAGWLPVAASVWLFYA